jgi:hypothetical protein
MRSSKDKKGNLHYPPQDGLFFLPGDYPPERVLCDLYEKTNNDSNLRYHIDDSNVHCLFNKMIELGHAANEEEAFNACWEIFVSTSPWKEELNNLVEFLLGESRRYSPDL